MAKNMPHRLLHRPCLVLLLVIIGTSCVQELASAAGGVLRPQIPAPSPSAQPEELKTYIAYMGEKPKSALIAIQVYRSIINKVLGNNGLDALLYSYTKSFSGFAVRMTEKQKNILSGFKGIVSIFESQTRQLQTTRSWDFMGFPLTFNHSTTESDIVVGVLDTGVWPESASFSDLGFGPPPAKWKGSCSPPTANFTCNNKIVGGKYYKASGVFGPTDVASPRDTEGHGTHTASTAAGGVVTGASMLGLGLGTARGGVPAARVAIYKICWSNGCADEDILAAFDDAIADGVDIISLSVGGNTPRNYFEDAIAIGSYHAMKAGILASISAGNSGPDFFTTTNVAPWSLGVAASTTDRKYVTSVQLGNSQTYQGVSLNTFDISNQMHQLIFAGDAPNVAGGFDSSTSQFCVDDSLDPLLVQDKIVLCASNGNGEAAFVAGAAGALYADDGFKDVARPSALPASYLDVPSGTDIYTYMSNDANPTGTIFKTVDGNDTTAPVVGSFSSRGPSPVTLDILKPDISAPGVNILAAWPTVAPVTSVVGDTRSVNYNIISGTSMACPHASGVAAFIKSFNPTWSPAAIKSAMMTTAFPMSPITTPEAEYGYGAGHVNPIKAVSPGLVYDAGPTDYINFLCADGYTTQFLRIITGDNSECPTTPGSVHDLNYPSFSLATTTPTAIPVTTYRRTVTNVGSPTSTYTATIAAPVGLNVQVTPSTLTFASLGESQSYTLTVSGAIQDTVASASLIWDDGVHQVRSPIAVIWVILG
uniref:Cucumisin n=1 Tax=Kalanchoe fedtschenkoi TaxID=63787 RepID=A0A7N0V3U3_KALFE